VEARTGRGGKNTGLWALKTRGKVFVKIVNNCSITVQKRSFYRLFRVKSLKNQLFTPTAGRLMTG
jgi:hypothetical protein